MSRRARLYGVFLCACALSGTARAEAGPSQDANVPYEYHPAPPKDGITVPPGGGAPAKPFSLKFSETRSLYPAGRVREVPCREEDLMRSEDSAAPVLVEFRNTGRTTTELWWLDFKGKRVSYGAVAPGKGISIGTFATHPWVLAGKGGKCRVILVPRDPARALLGP